MPENCPLLHWFLPAGGDRADISRPVQLARAAEQAGFTSLFAPVGPGRADPWQLASVLAGQTERLAFLVGVRAGAASPTLLAQQADAFRRFTGGRLRLHVTARDGDRAVHDQRYGRTDEVMAALRDLLDGRRIAFQGQHVQVEGARLADPAVEHKVPLYFGGTPGAGENVAARRADVHVVSGSAGHGAVAARIARLRDRNPALRFALCMNVADAPGRTAQLVREYRRLGVDEFVLSGRPEPDEVLRVGAEVRGLENAAAPPPRGTGRDGAALASDGVTPAIRRSGRCRRGCR
ncbi:LLM class flavin-dependent oxidoreductase [Streptomyces sp. NPDC050095]|uniref:LLM class flavin-dependent oxidoreductase n=1 Tax=unclassified Streptomyces TaxID=2593676 RepID=UPI003419D209